MSRRSADAETRNRTASAPAEVKGASTLPRRSRLSARPRRCVLSTIGALTDEHDTLLPRAKRSKNHGFANGDTVGTAVAL